MNHRGLVVAGTVAMLLLGVLIGAAAVSYETVSGDVTLTTNSGVAVTTADHGGGMELTTPFVNDRTVRLVTQNGNVTVSGGGPASLTVRNYNDGVTVRNFSSSSTVIRVAPGSGDTLRLNGTLDSATWDQIAIGDGTADVSTQFGPGESATLRFDQAAANTDYQLLNATDDRVALARSSASGVVNFTVAQNTSYRVAEFDNALPTLTNPSPTGQIVENSVTLSIDVADDQLPSKTVDLTYRVNGNVVEQRTVSSEGTQQYTLTKSELPGAGSHDWTVTATDPLGAESTASGSFGIASNMTVVNISNTSQAIPDARATFILENGTITRPADANGNVSLSGLPGGQRIPVEINATNYYDRTTVIPTVVQAQDAYLLNRSKQSVLNRFTLTDATGEYDRNAVVILKRPVNNSQGNEFRRVAGDRIGVEGFPITLKQGQRYRVVLKSTDGDIAQLGKYIATQSQEVPLRPETVTVEVEGERAFAYNASVEAGTLQLQYLDPTEETDVLTISVVNRFNNSDYLFGPVTYYGVNSLTLSEPVGKLNKSYVAIISGQRNGTQFRAQIALGPSQRPVVPSGLSLPWVQFAGIGLVMLVGGTFSRLNIGAGVVVTSTLAGVLWYIGLLQGVATWATVAVAMVFSVVYTLATR